MNILIYGAGVLGTLYAARLQEDGHEVSILARGRRSEDINAHGLVLENVLTGHRTTTAIKVVADLAPEDAYQLVIVLMGKDHVAEVLPILARNTHTPLVLFMLNNVAGPSQLIQALGAGRVMLGFPGAGGVLEGFLVRYGLIPQQPTMLGELDGRSTTRLRQILSVFRKAGFPTSASSRMDAWLKTHAAFITAVAGAIYMAGGDCSRLAALPDGVPMMVHGVREGFHALRKLGVPLTPLKLRVLFEWMPLAAPVGYWRRYFRSPEGEYFFAGHTRAAGEEMKLLADEFRALIRPVTFSTPALDKLCGYISRQ